MRGKRKLNYHLCRVSFFKESAPKDNPVQWSEEIVGASSVVCSLLTTWLCVKNLVTPEERDGQRRVWPSLKRHTLSSDCSHQVLGLSLDHAQLNRKTALGRNLFSLILFDWNLFMQPAEQVREGRWGTGGDNFIAHTAAAEKDQHLHPKRTNLAEIPSAQTWGGRSGAVGGRREGLTDERSRDGWCCSNSHRKSRKGNKRNRIRLLREVDLSHSCKHLWIPAYGLEYKYWQLLFFFAHSVKRLPVCRASESVLCNPGVQVQI